MKDRIYVNALNQWTFTSRVSGCGRQPRHWQPPRAQTEIARLIQLAHYRRAEFGRSSEKLVRHTEQLELRFEPGVACRRRFVIRDQEFECPFL
jgi:transposase IS166 family protein